MDNAQLIIPMVAKLLTTTAVKDWSAQGFGMYRLYLPFRNLRLTVWHENAKRQGVSLIHTHPWDFESLVVAGEMVNRRYIERASLAKDFTHLKSIIRAGEGGGLEGEATEVVLVPQPFESIPSGGRYTQLADEIHASTPANGTITLCDRRVTKESPDHALVYWRRGETWGSAEPRPADPYQWEQAVAAAMVTLEEAAREHGVYPL